MFTGILSLSYANEYSVFEKDKKKGLKDRHGKELIPPLYEEIGWSNGSIQVIDHVIGFKKEGQWGLINVKNSNITPARFGNLIPVDDQYIIASQPDSYKLNQMFGLINYSGKTIIDFRYTSFQRFGKFYVIGKKKNNEIFYGIIDHRNETVIPLIYISVDFITSDIAAFEDSNHQMFLVNQYGIPLLDIKIDDVEVLDTKFLMIVADGKAGLLDLNGKTISPLKYQKFLITEAGSLNGLPERRWEMLSPTGDKLLTFDYDQITPIDTGFYKVRRMGYSYIVNGENKEIFKIKNSEISFLNDSLALIRSRNNSGVIHYTGDTIIEPVYDSITLSRNRFFMHSSKHNQSGWEMADLYGISLTRTKFESLYHLDENSLAFKKNGFWGVMDNYGSEQIMAKFDSIYSKIHDRYLVDFYGEKGVINEDGDWKIYPQKGDVYLLKNGSFLISSYFQSRVISRFGNDLFVTENYLWPLDNGFIEEDFEQNFGLRDREFNLKLPIEYSFVGPIVDDSSFLFKNDKGWGIVDLDGEIRFENDNRFEEIIGYNEEFVGVKIEGYYGFVDLNGKLRIANRYEGINLFHEGIANIKILGKWGCVNKIENIVVQPYYDEIQYFYQNMAIAKKNSRYGILSNQGREVISFEYDSIYRIKNGNFICKLKNKYGLISSEGEIMFYPKFDLITDLNNGFVIAKRKNKYGVFSSSGVFIVPVIYDQIIYDPFRNRFLASNDPQWESILDITHFELY